MKHLVLKMSTGLIVTGLLSVALVASADETTTTTVPTTTKVAVKKVTHSQVVGTVVSVSETDITVQPTKATDGANQTIPVPASAEIMEGKKKVALSDLKAGEQVTIKLADGSATRIKARAPKVAKVHKTKPGTSTSTTTATQ